MSIPSYPQLVTSLSDSCGDTYPNHLPHLRLYAAPYSSEDKIHALSGCRSPGTVIHFTTSSCSEYGWKQRLTGDEYLPYNALASNWTDLKEEDITVRIIRVEVAAF
jgi:hypothetical protein